MNIQLEAFEGPLELLLHLIRKNEIDIYDIPISSLCRQYLDAIHEMPPDMEGMSEFMVMAATLLEIKSRMLLPKPPHFNEDEEEDPREVLVRRLVAYKHCQEMAEALKRVSDPGQRIYKKPEMPLMSKAYSRSPYEWMGDVTESNLWKIFSDIMQRQALKVDNVRQNFGNVSREQYTVADKIRQIQSRMKDGSALRLSDLFESCRSRRECVVTFLALLEMIRRHQAAVCQEDVFGEIEVLPCPICS